MSIYDPYKELGYKLEKLNSLPKPVLNLESLNWEYDKQGRRIEKKVPRDIPDTPTLASASPELTSLPPPSQTLWPAPPPPTNRKLRAKMARQRLAKLAEDAKKIETNTAYWDAVKCAEELRLKFEEDEKKRRGSSL